MFPRLEIYHALHCTEYCNYTSDRRTRSLISSSLVPRGTPYEVGTSPRLHEGFVGTVSLLCAAPALRQVRTNFTLDAAPWRTEAAALCDPRSQLDISAGGRRTEVGDYDPPRRC